MCIDCRKIVGCLLDNQRIENFITPLVKNVVFRHFGLSLIIKLNQKLNFYFQLQCNSWLINGPWHNTMICSRLRVSLF